MSIRAKLYLVSGSALFSSVLRVFSIYWDESKGEFLPEWGESSKCERVT